MKRKWKIITISVSLIGFLGVGIAVDIISEEIHPKMPIVNDPGYATYQQKYKKRVRLLKSAAYKEGVSDYNQGVAKKETGFDYSVQAEKIIKKTARYTSEADARIAYDDFYDKGYKAAEKETEK